MGCDASEDTNGGLALGAGGTVTADEPGLNDTTLYHPRLLGQTFPLAATPLLDPNGSAIPIQIVAQLANATPSSTVLSGAVPYSVVQHSDGSSWVVEQDTAFSDVTFSAINPNQSVTFTPTSVAFQTPEAGGGSLHYTCSIASPNPVLPFATLAQFVPPPQPPARTQAALVCCGPTGGEVLFGGRAADGTLLDDTWEFDSDTNQWHELFPAHNPLARAQAAAASDEPLVFGGESATGPLADTWLFDGTDWVQQQPAHVPAARGLASLTGVSLDRGGTFQTVLYGGLDSGDNALGDMWEWQNGDWVQDAYSPNPGARIAPLLWATEDDARGIDALVLGGGTPGATGELASLWFLTNPDFTPPTVSITSPASNQTVGMNPTFTGTCDASPDPIQDVTLTVVHAGSNQSYLNINAPCINGEFSSDPYGVVVGPQDSAPQLTDGQWQVQAQMLDAAQNETTTDSVPFTVATSNVDPPNTVPIWPPANGVLQIQNTNTVIYGCVDHSGTGIASCDGTFGPLGSPIPPVLGSHSYDITATDNAGHSVTASYDYSVVDSASQTLPDGGGTLSTSGTLSPDDPVQTSISTPVGGDVSITETGTSSSVTGYELAAQQVDILAPAASATQPLSLMFSLDPSALAETHTNPSTVQVFRDSVATGACADPSQRVASPDPCVFARTPLPGGGVQVGVYTSHASTWNFGGHTAMAPNAPTSVAATSSDASASVSFVPPATDGGSAITRYSATCTSSDGGATVSADGSGSPIAVPDASVGNTYTCTVTASNAVGTSAPSSASNNFLALGCTGTCVSVGNASVLEGDSTTRTMTFPVTLSRPATTQISVAYSITGVTATGATTQLHGKRKDFKLKSGVVTFAVGPKGATPISKTITVTVFGDATVESNETLAVTLSNVTGGYSLGRRVGTGTILDDDGRAPTSTLGIADGWIVGAARGGQSINIPVTLSAPNSDTVTISYTLSPGTATYSSKSRGGGDYGGKITGTITFAPGATTTTVSIPIWPHASSRPTKSFTITLSNLTGSGVALIRSTASATILGGWH